MKGFDLVVVFLLIIFGLFFGVVSFILFGKSFDMMPEWARLFVTGIVFMIISFNVFFGAVPSFVKNRT